MRTKEIFATFVSVAISRMSINISGLEMQKTEYSYLLKWNANGFIIQIDIFLFPNAIDTLNQRNKTGKTFRQITPKTIPKVG